MDIVIKPLTPALADDYLRFFDDTAFSDNPEWSGCYCCFYHITDGWEESTAAQNRESAQAMINSGTLNGYLAYIDGEPAGWVNAGPRNGYKRLEDEPLPAGDSVCSVVCFVIAPSLRRKGIATKLLQAAIDGAKGKYDFIEAYPRKDAHTCAHHYHGPLDMYEKAGFEVVEEKEGYYVVRTKIQG